SETDSISFAAAEPERRTQASRPWSSTRSQRPARTSGSIRSRNSPSCWMADMRSSLLQLEGELVDLALPVATGERLGDLLGALPPVQALAYFPFEIGRVLFDFVRGRRARDHHHHLAPDLAREAVRELRERATRQLLVHLGQLARHQRGTVPERDLQIAQGCGQPVRRFVKDELGPQGPQLLEHLAPGLCLPRKESGEMKSRLGKSAHADRG